MTAPASESLLGGLRSARIAISAAYGVQGFGYATVMTTLPAMKQRHGFDDTELSLLILGVCVTAAVGSIVAGAIASRRSSRAALASGLLTQLVVLGVAALPIPTPAYLVAIAVYGAGLGAVDAASGMQGVLLQNRIGRSIMSSLFAFYTGAAIAAALLVSSFASLGDPGATVTLAFAAALTGAVGLMGTRLFYVENLGGRDEAALQQSAGVAAGALGANDAATAPAPAAHSASDHDAAPSSVLSARRAIWLFGIAIFAIFVADSAVSTWSTIYLSDTLLTSAAVAPLAYAAYQAVILVTRMGGDFGVRRWGRAPLVVFGAVLSLAGFLFVAFIPSTWAAIAGFATVGVGVGLLVPMTFSAAGEVDPARNDFIISRMNLFNYVGAVIGGALIGVIADSGAGMALAFLLPAALLIPFFALARHYRHA